MVSIKDLIIKSNEYKQIAGDMRAQDFAILRLILAILTTIFQRYDFNGNEQRPKKLALHKTWEKLWNQKKFPENVINQYLDSVHERFYLYDDKYPFWQINAKENENIDKARAGSIKGKFLNRLISESDNMPNAFSPTDSENRDYMTDDQLARWLVNIQNYTGNSDKGKLTISKKNKLSGNPGQLLSIGGLYLRGNNLFETLMLNFILDYPHKQLPVWEKSLKQKINYDHKYIPDNLSELYTLSSRLLYLPSNFDTNNQPVKFESTQNVSLDLSDWFDVEPMTTWKLIKEKGDTDYKLYPRRYSNNECLWQLFGNFTGISEDNNQTLPRIMDWYYEDLVQDNLDDKFAKIVSVGLLYKDPTSKVISDEYYDELDINKLVLDDREPDGWVDIINDEVQKINECISITKRCIIDIEEIKGDSEKNNDNYDNQLRFKINQPFKQWLLKLSPDFNSELLCKQWHDQLFNILYSFAKYYLYPLNVAKLTPKKISNNKIKNPLNAIQRMEYLKKDLNWRIYL